MFAAAEETALRVKVKKASCYLHGAKEALPNANSKASKNQSVFGEFYENGSSG